MKDKMKLKHLDIILDENPKEGILILMEDLFDYKNSLMLKRIKFNKYFNKTIEALNEFRKMDLEDLEINKDFHIKSPISINEIPYSAMLDVIQLTEKGAEDGEVSKHIAKVVSIATHEMNRETKYSHDSLSNRQYQERLLEAPLLDMISLFNWIIKDIQKVSKEWETLFLSVQVVDKELEAVGGSALSQFNIINTIKEICSDFNKTEKQSWSTSYNLVMTNSYAKSYENYLRNEMRIKREAELKAKNKNR